MDILIVGGLTRSTKFKEMDKTQADDIIFPAFSVEPEEQEEIYTETEIVGLLIEKGYLVAGDFSSNWMPAVAGDAHWQTPSSGTTLSTIKSKTGFIAKEF